ncbi:MAG: hypothetical protein APF81_09060 [Desulfosporosinus sp. BRH_c37]|nr:MAG: hypothetical protein APF81_09060 [Desulfosporosinus sp. BRH_c37]
MYSNFHTYSVPFQNITIYIASSFIGMIGIILAGIAVIVGKLEVNVVKLIEEINGKGTVEKILVSFEFLAFNIGIGIFTFLLLHIILYSNKPLICIGLFYTMFGLITYLFLFIIFYTVSLVSNTVNVFTISNTYNQIIGREKSLFDTANEIRIDFLLRGYIVGSREQFLRDLLQFVDDSNINNKEQVKNYFSKCY